MFRLKIAAIVGGAMLAFFGIQEYLVSMGTSVEPVDVNLANIEDGLAGENKHLRIGEHTAVYGGCVYQYRMGKYESGDPKPSTPVKYTYYPIISDQHAFYDRLGELADQYGSLDNIPDSEWPTIDDFSVLVKTHRFKTIASIPEGFGAEDTVQGLVINMIGGLDSEEKGLLRETFPTADLDKVLIVEDGRKPASLGKSLGMTAGGGILALLGVGGFILGRGQG